MNGINRHDILIPYGLSRPDEEEYQARVRWFRSLTPEQRLEQLGRWVEEALKIDPEIVNRKNAELPQWTENYRVLDLRDVKEDQK